MIRSAEVVIPCAELDSTLTFFTRRLGFRIEAILPADDPTVAVVSGHGVRLRLQRGARAAPVPTVLRLLCEDPTAVADGQTELIAPNGTVVELAPADPPVPQPTSAPSFVLSRVADATAPHIGRAGMQYRDLIPERQGGRIIASHIAIPDGGEVPDYVHYHKVRFQLVYCYRGWVRAVYEDQGPPFVMHAGDCVLQPPQIRHRVLECSPGLEVIEVGCPAEHETWADHELTLPTREHLPERDFSGQRFVRHVASAATWVPHPLAGFESRDTAIAAATDGLADVRVLRASESPQLQMRSDDTEIHFAFVLQGAVKLHVAEHHPEQLRAGDCFVVPSRTPHGFSECTSDAEVLEVRLPGHAPSSR